MRPIVLDLHGFASFRKAVSRLLRTAGFEVEALASAGEFLERPTVDRPSCLVLDVRMPGPSGMDLQSALAEAGRDIPIVFMTGHGDVSTSVRAMKKGAEDFLEKPFRAPELLAGAVPAPPRPRGRVGAHQGDHAAPGRPGGEVGRPDHAL